MSDNSEIKAIVAGVVTKIPDDLFIPPDALEVLLDSFSGPLDLLLYLIRRQNIDILNIPIMSITQQYLKYIQLMEYHKLELAADYLLMAATLAEIKSKLLLPNVLTTQEPAEEDPRMHLVRRLQAYEQIKQAALLLDSIPRKERDTFLIHVLPKEIVTLKRYPEIALQEITASLEALLAREDQLKHHQITREVMSVRERMGLILLQIKQNENTEFRQLYTSEEGHRGLIVSLLAVLELAKLSLIVITQNQAFSPIYLQVA